MSRAGEAKALLNNPVLAEAFDFQRKALLSAALRCSNNDDIGRYRLLEAIKVVDGVVGHLQAIIEVEDAAAREKEADAIHNYYETKAQHVWNAASHGAMTQKVA